MQTVVVPKVEYNRVERPDRLQQFYAQERQTAARNEASRIEAIRSANQANEQRVAQQRADAARAGERWTAERAEASRIEAIRSANQANEQRVAQQRADAARVGKRWTAERAEASRIEAIRSANQANEQRAAQQRADAARAGERWAAERAEASRIETIRSAMQTNAVNKPLLSRVEAPTTAPSLNPLLAGLQTSAVNKPLLSRIEAPTTAPSLNQAPTPKQHSEFALIDKDWEKTVDDAFVPNAQFQVGSLNQIGRVRTTKRGRQLMSLDAIPLDAMQREAAKAIHGQQLAGDLDKTWQNSSNAREQGELTEIDRLWKEGTSRSQQQARDLARDAFNRHRARFWTAVRGDPNVRAAFEAAGMRFTGADTTAPFYDSPDGTRLRMTLEHSVRLADNPVRALSGNNLQFVLNDENSVFLESIRANDPFQREQK